MPVGRLQQSKGSLGRLGQAEGARRIESHTIESQFKGFSILFVILWNNGQDALQNQVFVQVRFKKFRHCPQSNRVAEDGPPKFFNRELLRRQSCLLTSK